MLSAKNRKKTLLLIIGVVLTTLISTFAFVKFVYSPNVGHYTYNASPKFGGVSFPPFGFVLGNDSQIQIAAIVKKYHLVGAGLTLTDFEKNERPLIWWMIDKEKYPELYSKYYAVQEQRKAEKAKGLSIFSEDETTNRIISKLLDGQHVCESIYNTTMYKLAPVADKYVDRICYAAIPPYGGAMSGYLSLYLPKDLTLTELAEIRSAMIEVQLDVFNRDIRHIPVSNGLEHNTPALSINKIKSLM